MDSVIQSDEINKTTIEQAIRRFRKVGETD